MRLLILGSRFVFAAGVAAVVALSLLPGETIPATGVWDKIEHFAAYALLGLTGGLAFPTRRAAMLLVLLLPALSIVLELGQMLSPDRYPDVADAAIGAIGACLGLSPVFGLCTRSSGK